MPVDNVLVLHGLKFPSGTFLSQLVDLTPASNLNEFLGYASGYPDPLFTAASSSKIDLRFNTNQIKALLDLCGATNIADQSGGNVDAYYKQCTDLGIRQADATTVHQRFRMAASVVYWEEINVSQADNATASGRLLPLFNGTNAPVVPAGSVALSGTPTAAEFFGLGPLEINGSQVFGIDRLKIGLGIQMMEIMADGDFYNTFCALSLRAQYIEAETHQVGTWNTFGTDGTALSSVVAYLRKRSQDNGYVANGTASHISFTGGAGRITVQNTRGGGNTPAKTTLRIPLRTTAAGTAVLAINTATAIT